MSRNLVPVGELPAAVSEEYNIAWQLNLPPNVEQGQIGLDLSRTQLLARIAGLGGVIVGEYWGEKSEISFSVSGVDGLNQDGSATGVGRAHVTAAKTERSSLQDDRTSHLKEYQWPIARLAINRNELGSRISDRVQAGMPAETAWTNELDRSLRRGLHSAAKDKLIGDIRYRQNCISLPTYGLMWYHLINNLVQNNILWTGVDIAAWYGGAAAIGGLWNKLRTGDTQLDRRRWSIFPFSVQPDRFALAAAMSATTRLVRPIKGASEIQD